MKDIEPDEVYSTYGRAMSSAQLIEQDVENFVWALLKQYDGAKRAERDILESQTLGVMWRSVEPRCRDVDEIWTGNIRIFIRARNYLAHHFFLDSARAIHSPPGAMAALEYLAEFTHICDAVKYQLSLLAEALSVPVAKRFSGSMERSLAERAGVDENTILKFRSFSPDA